jgi:hypothetical protein
MNRLDNLNVYLTAWESDIGARENAAFRLGR